MTISVPSRPIVGSTIRVADLNSSMQTNYQVRSVARSSFQLLDVATGEVQERTFDIQLSGNLAEKLGVSVTEGHALGNNTNKVSTFENKDEIGDGRNSCAERYRRAYRDKRYCLRDIARRILSGLSSPSDRTWRTCACGVVRQDAKKDITLKYGERGAHCSNLILCGSVWTCPICANKVAQERRRQIAAVNAKMKDEGKKAVLLTYTLQHGLSDSLVTLFDDLKGSVKSTQTGRKRQEFCDELGVTGFVRSVEIRFSKKTGWHPHIHELLYVDGSMSDENIICAVQSGIGSRYRNALSKRGYTVNEHTFDARIAENIDQYLTKSCLELEVTDGQGKDGRNGNGSLSAFQMLDEIDQTADTWLTDKFREYAYATFRKRQLTFSRNLLAKCGVDDKKDSEIVAEKESVGRDVLYIPLASWQQLVKSRLIAKLLTITEQYKGDTVKVLAWLRLNGISWVDRPSHFVNDPP